MSDLEFAALGCGATCIRWGATLPSNHAQQSRGIRVRVTANRNQSQRRDGKQTTSRELARDPMAAAGSDSANDAQWANPDNWNGSIYFAKADTRVMVPKQPSMFSRGWTVNLGHPTTETCLIVGLVAIPLIIVAAESGLLKKAFKAGGRLLGR